MERSDLSQRVASRSNGNERSEIPDLPCIQEDSSSYLLVISGSGKASRIPRDSDFEVASIVERVVQVHSGGLSKFQG